MPFHTGPQISSILPSNDSEGISALITVKVKFTEMMSSETLTENYIYIRPSEDASQKIPSTLSFESGDNTIIEITPKEPLGDKTEYEIVVSGQSDGQGIEDILGNPMLETYVSSFKTAEQSLSIPSTEGGEIAGDIEVGPYVVSNYPRDNEYNVTPTYIKVKIADQDNLLTLPLSVGSGEASGDFNLIEGEVSERDLVDIDILPMSYVEGTLEFSNNIIKFAPATSLDGNSVYSIVLTGQFLNHISRFRSGFEYFYGDVDLIKSDLSKYIKISDWLLAQHIANVSREAYEIAYATYEDSISYNDDDRPYYIDEYVRYKVGYELTNTKYIELTTGSSMVTLGEFVVQNTVNAQGLGSFMEGLRVHMKKWEDLLHGHSNRGYAKPIIVDRKTSEDSGSGYPEYIDRRFKDIDGTKSD